ncbi:MAG TPA: magnesium transporter [Dehalococcoidia bacterium]|nr:magnesium transporter [Dehalococcoidia bacterium]
MERGTLTRPEEIRDLIADGRLIAARRILLAYHPADAADILLDLDEENRRRILPLIPADVMADVLEQLDEDDFQDFLPLIALPALTRILDRMESDVAADVLQSLPLADRSMALSAMTNSAEVAPLLLHEEDSAGGIMTRGFVTLRADMTADEAIEYLRLVRPDAEESYYLYVVDHENHLQGVVSLRNLIVAPALSRVEELMSQETFSVSVDLDQEEAARVVERYDLRSLPVVDSENRLVGIVTQDDIIDVVEAEATEDMYLLHGVTGLEGPFSPLHTSVRRRLPWLLVNILTALSAAIVVSLFQGTIEKAAVLAVFMPVIAGQGGNAGIQTLTIIVRSLALGEMELRDSWQVLAKQLAIGLCNGLAVGLVVGTVAFLWEGNFTLGVVVTLAMLANVGIVASLGGVLVPTTLRFLGFDPALAAGIFVTMLTDLLGFLTFLGLAALLISRID